MTVLTYKLGELRLEKLVRIGPRQDWISEDRAVLAVRGSYWDGPETAATLLERVVDGLDDTGARALGKIIRTHLDAPPSAPLPDEAKLWQVMELCLQGVVAQLEGKLGEHYPILVSSIEPRRLNFTWTLDGVVFASSKISYKLRPVVAFKAEPAKKS